MSILIDIIIIAIIGVCIFLGYKRGLIGVIFKILSFFIAVIVALVLFKPVSYFVINNTKIDEQIESSIIEIIEGTKEEATEEEKEKSENTPDVIMEYINSNIEKVANEAKTNIAQTVASDITINIINAGVIIILFIIARIVLIFIKIVSDAIAELPIIKQFNKLGGTIYGILEGFFIVYTILAIISLFVPIATLQNLISNSIIGSILYNHNIILMILF